MMTEEEFLKHYDPRAFPVPLITVDVVAFAYEQGELSVLLTRRQQHPFKGVLALPGGFIDIENDDTPERCALRKLEEKVSVRNLYLEQVKSIGASDRDPRGWCLTVLYFALIDPKTAASQKESLYPLSKLPKSLAFDHLALIHEAHDRLKNRATYTAIGSELLPKKFTLTELQHVYECLLERPLQAKSFRRRFERVDVLKETAETKVVGKRWAKLYMAKAKARTYYFPQSLRS